MQRKSQIYYKRKEKKATQLVDWLFGASRRHFPILLCDYMDIT